MKANTFTTAALLAIAHTASWGMISLTGSYTSASAQAIPPSQLENIRQLLTSRQCVQCNLSRAGLIVTNLAGVNLAGANLSRANLSRANLDGADLRGADLSGANLNGANLSGAILVGARVDGADFRNTTLFNADLRGVNLQGAFIQGAQGVPNYAGSPDNFYAWAVGETGKGNYRGAIEFYNQALGINNEYAPAYLGRAISRYRMGDVQGAAQDAVIAKGLFTNQQNPMGIQASQNFIQGMEAALNPSGGGGGDFFSTLGSIGVGLLQLLF